MTRPKTRNTLPVMKRRGNMRQILVALVVLAGCSGGNEAATTTEAPATTEAASTATIPPAALDRAEDCLDMQISAARSLAMGYQQSEVKDVAMSDTCDDATDQLSAAGGIGSTPANNLAVELASNSVTLATWNVSLSFGTEVAPSSSGVTPMEAGKVWRAKFREVIGG